MAKEFTLHFFPGSYFSLKAFLALQEKGIPFKENIVNIYDGEQYSDWFLKLNPKGEVPVLQHGDTFIPDSEAIIEYIDLHCSSGPTLVPDVETSVGQEVHQLRHMLNDIPIGVVTFGVLANRNLCTSDLKFPPKMTKMLDRKGVETRYTGNIKTVTAARDRSTGETRTTLSGKVDSMSTFLSTVLDVESVSIKLDELEKVFDKLEDQLEKSRKGSEGAEDYWLVGGSITIADIIAAILMYRLYLLGIDNRYFSDTKRVIVKKYCNRLMNRQAVKNTVAKGESAGKVMAKAMVWKFAKIGLIVGAVALGLFAAREVLQARNGVKRV